MKILILEDEEFYTKKIINIVKKTIEQSVIVTHSTILSCLKDSNSYDLAIIDVMLPDGDGIEYIHNHRNQFESILFLTSMENRMIDAFDRNVVGFIPKDKMDTLLHLSLHKVFKEYKANQFINLNTETGNFLIPFKEIIFIQTEQRKIKVTCTKHSYLLKRQSLSKFSEQFDSRFTWINQSTIINLDYVSQWIKEEIILNETYKVYASRNYSKAAFRAFSERL